MLLTGMSFGPHTVPKEKEADFVLKNRVFIGVGVNPFYELTQSSHFMGEESRPET